MPTPLGSAPQTEKSFATAIGFVLEKFAQRFECCLPARLIAFDRAKNTATIQPMVMVTVTNAAGTTSKMSRTPIQDVPVLSIGGGGFHVSFPLAEGDLGWLHASDRDISLFMQGLSESPAPTTRAHRLADGMFVPDVFRQYSIAGEDSGAMVLQTTDGATRIAIDNGEVRITAPTRILCRTPLVETTQDVHIRGTLMVDQLATMQNGMSVQSSGGGSVTCQIDVPIVASKPVTLPSDVKVGGVQVFEHDHISSSPGTDTGPMK